MAGRNKANDKSKKSTKTSSANLSDAVASASKPAEKAGRATAAGMGALGEGAAEFNRKCIDFAKANMDASFNLATALAAAKTPAEAMQIQADFMRKQFETMTSQSRELAELVGRVGMGAGNPLAELMSSSNWPFLPMGRK